MRVPVQPAEAPDPQGGYSPAIVSDGLVFASGQAALDPATGELVAGDVAAQTTLTLDNLEAVLRAAGSGLGDVLKTTVHLADIASFDAFDAAYRARMPRPYPARTTVGSALAPGLLVEIDVVARVGAGAGA
jgi:2-iminobutanoate/2-iminopropanoate deaminase